MRDWRKWIRFILGAAIAFVVFSVVMNLLGDYRTAKQAQQTTPVSTADTGPASSVAQTGRVPGSTQSATQTAAGSSKTKSVVIMVSGVNLRQGPATTDDVIRKLKQYERLTYVSTKNNYYQVRDASGVTGWVSAKKGYTRIVTD